MNLAQVVGRGRQVVRADVVGAVLATQVDLRRNLDQPAIGVVFIELLASGSEGVCVSAGLPCPRSGLGAIQKLDLLTPPHPYRNLLVVEASVRGGRANSVPVVGPELRGLTLDIDQGAMTSPGNRKDETPSARRGMRYIVGRDGSIKSSALGRVQIHLNEWII